MLSRLSQTQLCPPVPAVSISSLVLLQLLQLPLLLLVLLVPVVAWPARALPWCAAPGLHS